MTVRVAINGFGRIGRNVVRALYESGRRAEITVVAINELADAAGMADLLKYDTSHGRFAWDVRQEREQLIDKLTKEMKQAAKLLEFEQAAFLRDKINKLKEELER